MISRTVPIPMYMSHLLSGAAIHFRGGRADKHRVSCNKGLSL